MKVASYISVGGGLLCNAVSGENEVMDSYKESREVFGALFSDPKKYAALKNALAEIMYREFQK